MRLRTIQAFAWAWGCARAASVSTVWTVRSTGAFELSWSLSARVCVCFFVLNACISVQIRY